MEENINERLSELGTKILATTRNELYIHMRFLDVALSSFAYVIDPSVNGVGTDGMCIFYHPGALGGMYRQNRVRMNRAYLHMVLHCILHHVTRRKGRDKTLWNISCDIAVESIIDHWHLKCIHMVQTRLRKDIYGQLERNLKVLTAEGIYRQLVSFGLEEKKIKELQMEFRVDDHQYWPEDPKQDLHQEVENKWKNISEKTETDMETFSSEESQQAGDLIGQVQVENRDRYDYREFLRKFSVLREEVSVDPDSFDYIFYSYGLSMYGNMPLIEPQEWKEVKKVEDFAIVIDTSMSCSGDLVKKFLEETYGVLTEAESFFHKVNIHIIQCDEMVQNDQKITDEKELKEYMEHLFSHRFGKEIQVGFDFTDDAKQAFYKARNHKLNLEVDMVMSQIKKVESEKKENGAEEGKTPKEEKKHHNVIFVGRDADGIPRYAHCRGTGEIKYRGDITGSDKSYGFSYRGTDNQLFVFEAAIDLLSFIQLFPKDWKKRSYLSLGGVSSMALMAFLSERPQITSVFLCLDNDQAGNEACEKLAGEISEGYSVIRLKPYKKDWNEILCDKNADRKKVITETITIKVPEAEELVPMLCYEDIEQTSVDWLWFPYIPFGKLTIIQGNPGEGKTYFAMMLTAACTNRKLFPNMEDIEPFNVIYQTAEDGMGDTIKPRLVEAGADLSRVMVIDDTEEALTLSDDRIEKAVRQNQVRLVIIDPVQAFIGADVDMNRANEVRPVFRKLGMIAEKTGCAIVLIGHLNKSSGTQSTYRGLGSIDIMAAVRSLIFIGKVRKDPTTRVLIHEKSSLAPPGETMAFKLGDEEGFRWVGAYEISADELLDGKEGKATETKLERGAKLIRELLADKKEISIRELDEKAKEQGISGRTMRDVRSRMKNELEYKVNEKQENSIRLKE